MIIDLDHKVVAAPKGGDFIVAKTPCKGAAGQFKSKPLQQWALGESAYQLLLIDHEVALIIGAQALEGPIKGIFKGQGL